jgi:excisionase family DNA binding protein
MALGQSPAPYIPSSFTDDLDLMTIEEVAIKLKVDKSTVYKMIRKGEMRSIHFGRSVRIMRRDLAEFIEQNRGE